MQITPDGDATRGLAWPLIMAFIRLPLAFIGYGMAVYFFRPEGSQVGAAAGLIWSTVTISVVNLISLGLLIWRFRTEKMNLNDAIGFRKHRLLSDVGWGFLWSFVLYGVLVVGGAFTILCLHGTEGFAQFESIFRGDADFSFPVPSWIAFVSAIIFPLLNPPIEEMHYRGYVQPRLIGASGSVGLGIVISSAGFGLQHMAFAITLTSATAYAVGFFFWGLGAGFIVYKQQRLFPIIVAHFISNLSFGIVPLLFSMLN